MSSDQHCMDCGEYIHDCTCGYGCILPFSSTEPEFAFGVEIGRLWEQLKTGEEVTQVVHAENAEMLIRLGEATGRTFAAIDLDEQWIDVTFAANQNPSNETGRN